MSDIAPSIAEVIQSFKDAMASRGLPTDDYIDPSGTLHRFRVTDDPQGVKTGWYVLHFDDMPAGSFGCNKRYGDEKIGWSFGRKISTTPAQRREFAIKAKADREEKEARDAKTRADAAVRAQALWNNAVAAKDHPYLTRKGVKSYGLRVGNWEIIDKKTGELKIVSNQALLVPMCDRTRDIKSMQAIMPKKNIYGRDKDYLAGGEKQGMFFPIGKPREHNGKRVFIVAEGYATAATVHEATGHFVMVCFDTSNLKHVAAAVRERQPEAIIIFAADNDLGVTQPVTNPGIYYAKLAAAEVGGLIAIPNLKLEDGERDEKGKWSGPTDFNDQFFLHGMESVTEIFDAVLNGGNDPEGSGIDDAPWEGQPDFSSEEDEPVEASTAVVPAGAHDENELIKQAGFTILGYDQSEYYLFHYAKQQVMTVRKSDMTDVGLIELQDPFFWESNFPGSNGGFDKKAIAHWLFSTAHARGIYDPTRVRGRGAWVDKGRLVFHYGSHLNVDGERVAITEMKSGYVYPLGRSMPKTDVAMTDEEGQWLANVSSKIRWTRNASALLFSGWVMLAPICGALSWRPHIWLLGAAGSGKSTVQTKFAGALLRDVGLYAQGDSTEPGIRQNLRADALPVLIDEIESNNEQDKRRTESIIGMVRKTSSESNAKTYKGTAGGDSMSFQIRSMFCLASINANLPTKADIDRLTRLTIRAPQEDREETNAHWKLMEADLNKIDLDEEISSRLLARAINNLPIIHHNIAVFRKFCAAAFGSQRDGDQFGTLLAGHFSLISSQKATEYDVRQMIAGFDFGEHVEDHDQDDATKALETILSSKIRMNGGFEYSVYELIREASLTHNSNVIDSTTAEATLRRHGIRIETALGQVWFGVNNSALKDMVANKSFVTDLRGQLLRIAGAERVEHPKRFNGMQSRCVAVPLGPILNDSEDESELPV